MILLLHTLKLQLPTDWEKTNFQLLCALRAEGSQRRCFPKNIFNWTFSGQSAANLTEEV